MDIILWYVFPVLLFSASTLTIFVRDPIYSLLYLILTFVIASFILILLNLDSIGFIFLIVYVGAVLILFLFVIMMLVESHNFNEKFSNSLFRYFPFTLFFLVLFL